MAILSSIDIVLSLPFAVVVEGVVAHDEVPEAVSGRQRRHDVLIEVPGRVADCDGHSAASATARLANTAPSAPPRRLASADG